LGKDVRTNERQEKHGAGSHPLRHSGTGRASRRHPQGIVRSRSDRPPAGRTSLFHHLSDRRAGRSHLPAPEVQISRADDHRHPAPVLGNEGHRFALRDRPVLLRHPEKLFVPFNAIRGFYDPSVNFELEFDVPLADSDELPEAEITAYPVAAEKAEKTDDATAKPADGEEKKPGSVVSLDAFRKKQ
jgi:hypothetical protein